MHKFVMILKSVIAFSKNDCNVKLSLAVFLVKLLWVENTFTQFNTLTRKQSTRRVQVSQLLHTRSVHVDRKATEKQLSAAEKLPVHVNSEAETSTAQSHTAKAAETLSSAISKRFSSPRPYIMQ